ncbi:unnamed protein product [Soboliphyme baturini]|uniref:LMBR1 domain-containing protein 2 n=1 Tax=Soboliphyme baturini TaxID=241478 RepID=A0A183ITX8_9BILA|nr:unnamed protein product [Soboliphyme baturini]
MSFLVLELFLVFLLTIFLLHKYGNWRRQHLIVTLAVLLAWNFAFTIVFTLPLDVVLTFFKRCVSDANITAYFPCQNVTDNSKDCIVSLAALDRGCKIPRNYVPDYVLPLLWRIVYWTSQILTWIILPIMQSWVRAGEFSTLGKLKRALYNNAVYYGSLLLVFGFLLLYAAVKGIIISGENLKVICITTSNTWGLFNLVLLLGYGLVEVPRKIWLSGSKGYSLRKCYFQIGKLSTEKVDSEESLKETYKETLACCSNAENSFTYRAHAEVILQKFPEDFVRAMATKRRRDSSSEIVPKFVTDEKTLVNLHKRVITAVQTYHRSFAQYETTLRRALHFEDVAKSEQNTSHVFLHAKDGSSNFFTKYLYTPTVEWYWECMLRRYMLKGIGAMAAIMSAVIVWSELTFFSVHPPLSLTAIFVMLAARNEDYFYIEFSSFLIITYLCFCAYSSVFRLKVYRYYYLDSHHQTDENSLLFSAILLCRLTPPLCLNFLGVIHLDVHVTNDPSSTVETAYTKIMGHMDVIPIISNGFNVYFPMAVLVLCVFTYFRLGIRLLHFMGFEQFIGDDELTVELNASRFKEKLTERSEICFGERNLANVNFQMH